MVSLVSGPPQVLLQASQKSNETAPQNGNTAPPAGALSVMKQVVEVACPRPNPSGPGTRSRCPGQADGYGGLYRGIAPELFRGMLSTALLMMVKEKIYLFNRRLIVGDMRQESR